MVEHVDLSVVSWARAQFALTAMFHWIFVPLTLGLSFLLAFFETFYYKTGRQEWKRITKFWMSLFAVNFAIGVATGIILEFEFGTNWSNYSWMVGDIFGAPLAIEGIFAFFLEATFFAVMFFGWDRVSKGFHLFSTWMVAVGSNLSALWILVANGWMQYPVGMTFNPDKARFEMRDIGAVIFSPTAIGKFAHATSSGFTLAAFFVICVSSWFLLKGRHRDMARKSILVASVFGLLSSLFVAISGDEAAYTGARVQPMKLAAMEGLYNGVENAGIVAVGLPNFNKEAGDDQDSFYFAVEAPGLLSLLANRELGSFVPGVKDLVFGNDQRNIMGVTEKIRRGREAVAALAQYQAAKNAGREDAGASLARFRENQEFFGYGHLEDPFQAIPPVWLTFFSFRTMVILGTLFPLLFGLFLYFAARNTLDTKTWLLRAGVGSLFLAHIAGQAGWVVAEVGRQPWAIQGLLPVTVARSNLPVSAVQTTFFIFLAMFAVLLIAEIRIMIRQIAIGPEEGENK